MEQPLSWLPRTGVHASSGSGPARPAPGASQQRARSAAVPRGRSAGAGGAAARGWPVPGRDCFRQRGCRVLQPGKFLWLSSFGVSDVGGSVWRFFQRWSVCGWLVCCLLFFRRRGRWLPYPRASRVVSTCGTFGVCWNLSSCASPYAYDTFWGLMRLFWIAVASVCVVAAVSPCKQNKKFQWNAQTVNVARQLGKLQDIYR